MQDPFWKDDITVLYRYDRIVEFVPTVDMALNERLNALTRFSIYLGVLLCLVYNTPNFLYLPLATMALMCIVYLNYPDLLMKISQLGGAASYQQPTRDNPFMNVMLSDYTANPQRAPAGDVTDPKISSAMNKEFSSGLYRDANDIWDRNNSQRQYYSMPSSTIPNDRASFMNWCWKTPPTCKDGNLSRCLRYEDPRQVTLGGLASY